ncbi:MAG: hypothetical protein QOJ64_459 [Acidobacteriota bacterium]|jgi:hypothetical protein|nr:hypothetical protein [Acidobacteriota bacterium]
MRECFEEGILQSYLDNELSPEMSESVAVHLAACSTCAHAFAAASDEALLLANAFQAEMSLEVPSVKLRERIDAAIAGTVASQKRSFGYPKRGLQTWFATLAGRFNLSPQQAFGFASLIAVIAFAAIFAVIRSGYTPTRPAEVARLGGTSDKNPGAVLPTPTPSPSRNNDETEQPSGAKPGQPAKPKRRSDPNVVPEPSQLPRYEVAKALPGERNFLKAIDSLAVEIDSTGDTAMKPSLRAEYERNLAVVNQAIDSTRRVARLHPGDPDAAAFLYSSYQSKLDLLSAVAEQVRPTIATR